MIRWIIRHAPEFLVAAGFWLVGSASVLTVGVAASYMPTVLPALFPIVDDFVTADVEYHGSEIWFRGRFTKLRPCKPVSISWYELLPNGESVASPEVHPVKIGVDPPLVTRPTGRQISSWFSVPHAGAYFALIEYSCAWIPWLPQARWGPFSVR